MNQYLDWIEWDLNVLVLGIVGGILTYILIHICILSIKLLIKWFLGRRDSKVTIIGSPFVPVKDRVLGPAEGPRLAFDIEPTRDEFISEKVHFPPGLMKELDDLLANHREALVVGPGASGKTILAYGYGFRHQGSAFYLDCKEHVDTLDVGVIRERVGTSQSSKLLLIIDNVHLIPEKFEHLHRVLRNLQALDSDKPTSNAFSVLYLGRRTQHHVADNSKATERMEAAKRVIPLQADKHMFEAVYRLFASRHKVSLLDVPDTTFDRWVHDFAGDLISFAVAIQALGPELINPNLISPELALENIRSRYLEPLDTVSYRNLLLLCVMAELELVTHRKMFELPTPVASPFPKLLRTGIVYEHPVGVEVKYDLFHPSIGSLILRADAEKHSKACILKDGCFRCPSSFVHILMRMYNIGLFDEAKELGLILKRPDFFALCSESFKANEWHKLLRTLTRSAPDIFLLVEKELQKEAHLGVFVQQTIRSPLQFISSLIRYLKRRSPDLAEVLQKALLEEENLDALLANTLERPLADLSLFLTYADKDMPEVAQALSERLSLERYKQRLLDKLLEAELHSISRFLHIADERMQHIATYLKNALSNKQNLSLLLERSVQIRAHLLVEFMEYADKSLPQGIGNHIKKGLAKKAYRDKLLEQILSTELGRLKKFFRYANRAMPKVAEALREGMACEEHHDKLLNHALKSPLHDLGSFLQYAQDNMPEVIRVLDAGLASERYKYQLLDRALRTDLHLVGAFLRVAAKTIPSAYQAVRQGLVSIQHREQLLVCATDTPFGNLKSFLTKMEIVDPEVSTAIKEGLTDEKHIIHLRNRALETPLNDLASFLRYADTAMPNVSKVIKDWLEDESNRDILIARAGSTQPQHLKGFLNYAEREMPKLFEAIRT